VKPIVIERTLTRQDYSLHLYPDPPSSWMNGAIFFGRSFRADDPWWDILELSGRVRITFEPLEDQGGFQGP